MNPMRRTRLKLAWRKPAKNQAQMPSKPQPQTSEHEDVSDANPCENEASTRIDVGNQTRAAVKSQSRGLLHTHPERRRGLRLKLETT